MTTYSATIEDSNGNPPTFGDHVSVVRTIEGLTDAQVIDRAWLTVKRRPSQADVDAALQLVVTTTETAAGQVTNDGAAAESGEVTFRISGSDYDELTAERTYHYDVQALLTDGTIATLEVGRVRWVAEVTQATGS